MRRLPFLSLAMLACAAHGCSLRSLDELNRCTGVAVSAACPSEGAGGAQGGAQTAAAGVAAGGVMASAGSPDAGGALGEAGVGGAGVPEPELILMYADHPPDDPPEPLDESKALRPIFLIENRSAEPVDVSQLSIRYYYTLEAPIEQVFACDFVNKDAVVSDCDGVMATFGTLGGDVAKHYAELTFVPPEGETWLIPELGGQSGPIQVRFYKANFSLQDQENDYSFDQSKVDVPEPWDHVTLYRSGELVWGIEPP